MVAIRVDESPAEPGVVVNPEGASLPARALWLMCRSVVRPVFRHYPLSPKTMPLASTVVDGLVRLRPKPSGVQCEQVRLDGFDMEILRPTGPQRPLSDGVVMYMHGGGFFLCGLDSHRPVAAALAHRTGLPVLNVGYRQLPKTRITGSVDDCLTAYRWLLRRGVDPARIVFAGDSAGGFLSFATALRAIEDGLHAPAGLVGLSPALDLDRAAKQDYVNVDRDAYIPLAGLGRMARYGARGAGNELSPVNGALAGLPPALLIVGEDELLRYDAELMARRLTAAGVPNSLELWRGQVHAFTSILPDLPESRSALDRVARFVGERLAAEPPARSA